MTATDRLVTQRIATRITSSSSGRLLYTAGIELSSRVRFALLNPSEGIDMKLWRLTNLAIAALAAVWLNGLVLAAQGAQGQAPAGKKAGEFFKAVSTSTLKELSVDDFVASMGLISANLGLDCADCHPNAGTDKADFVIDTPRKITTRRMVEMVAGINRTNFAGMQRVTCWTCHHGRITPATTIALDAWYDTPNIELDDAVRQESGLPTADQLLNKYVEAVGGAARLAGLTTVVATGNALR